MSLATLAIAFVLCKGISELAFVRWSEQSLYALKCRMFKHLHRVPMRFIEGEQTGRLNALFTNDAVKVGRLYNVVCRESVLGSLQLIIISVVLISQYGRLALWAFALLPIYIVFPLLSASPIRNASREVQAAEGLESARLQETLDGIRDIKAFENHKWRTQQFSPILRAGADKRFRISLLRAAYSLDYALYWTAMALVYWLGGQQVLAGALSIGQLVALGSYLGALDSPVSGLLGIHSQVQSLHGPVRRVLQFLAVPVEQDAAASGVSMVRAPTVQFEQVSFYYTENNAPAVSTFSLRVRAGQRVAIVGPSGAGKSSLIKLLLRFYDPQSGSIQLDGRDLRDYNLGSLRSSIGTVFQDPFLFSGSVRENIRFGCLTATDLDVQTAARMANAHEFIEQLPSGYDTEIGERGVRLSVGQRQRIALARVGMRAPQIVLLDEPTSALDAVSEQAVQCGLHQLLAGRTCFIVAHRLRTILAVDLIVVLDRGKLVGVGKHEELLNNCGLYRNLYECSVADVVVAQNSVGASRHHVGEVVLSGETPGTGKF
jgi:ABC-type multidrug transport system fused ATPase/permease subunit